MVSGIRIGKKRLGWTFTFLALWCIGWLLFVLPDQLEQERFIQFVREADPTAKVIIDKRGYHKDYKAQEELAEYDEILLFRASNSTIEKIINRYNFRDRGVKLTPVHLLSPRDLQQAGGSHYDGLKDKPVPSFTTRQPGYETWKDLYWDRTSETGCLVTIYKWN